MGYNGMTLEIIVYNIYIYIHIYIYIYAYNYIHIMLDLMGK